MLKERFTRKSLAAHPEFEASQAVTQIPVALGSQLNSPTATSATQRMSNADYQRRKMQSTGAPHAYRNSNASSSNLAHGDDKRRRSTSTTSGVNSSSHSNNAKNSFYAVNSGNYTQFGKQQTTSSQFNESKKLFSSTDDLTSSAAAGAASVKANKNRYSLNSATAASNSNSTNSGEQINKKERKLSNKKV